MEQQRPRLLSRGVVAYQHKRSRRRRRRSRGDFFFSNKAARRREEKEGETTNEEEDIAPSVCTVCVETCCRHIDPLRGLFSWKTGGRRRDVRHWPTATAIGLVLFLLLQFKSQLIDLDIRFHIFLFIRQLFGCWRVLQFITHGRRGTQWQLCVLFASRVVQWCNRNLKYSSIWTTWKPLFFLFLWMKEIKWPLENCCWTADPASAVCAPWGTRCSNRAWASVASPRQQHWRSRYIIFVWLKSIERTIFINQISSSSVWFLVYY